MGAAIKATNDLEFRPMVVEAATAMLAAANDSTADKLRVAANYLIDHPGESAAMTSQSLHRTHCRALLLNLSLNCRLP